MNLPVPSMGNLMGPVVSLEQNSAYDPFKAMIGSSEPKMVPSTDPRASSAAVASSGQADYGFMGDVTNGIRSYLDALNARIEKNNEQAYNWQLEAAELANQRYLENLATSAKFTRELRQTYYQDQVASLRAAGLNPVLAYSHSGSGNPVVSAQSYQASGSGINNSVNTDAVADYFGTFVSSAMELGGDLLQSVAQVLGNTNWVKALGTSAKAVGKIGF